MKICFFDRCNLVYLYGAIDNALSNKYKFVHVAYSQIEYDVLINEFHIPSTRVVNFKKLLSEYISKDYSEFDFDNLDILIQESTEQRFNMNLSIQVDRGLKYKTYDESANLYAALYSFWDEYFEKENPNIVIHEMVSLSINHICAVVAKMKKILYVNEIQVPGLFDTNLFFANYWGGKPVYTKDIDENIQSKVEKYVLDFNNRKQNVLCGNMFKTKTAKQYLFSAIKRYFSLKMNSSKYTNLVDYVENFIENDRSIIDKYRNLKKYSQVRWDSFDKTKKYYYYPFHLEPEAAVFFWGDGIYANQIKLIQNIAASLPPNTYLYVKDHPHNIGYRNYEDYLQLKQVNNIKVLYAQESGYEIIKHSKGVITINGSAGFEALLMNKPVFCFGNPYYENFNNVIKIKNIRDLRSLLKKQKPMLSNKNNFLHFFSNVYEGNVAIYYRQKSSANENLKKVIDSYDSYFSSFGK